MSSWHYILIFHLRNGDLYEQKETRLLLLSLPFSFLVIILWSTSDKDFLKGKGIHKEEGKFSLFSFHRNNGANENGLGLEDT